MTQCGTRKKQGAGRGRGPRQRGADVAEGPSVPRKVPSGGQDRIASGDTRSPASSEWHPPHPAGTARVVFASHALEQGPGRGRPRGAPRLAPSPASSRVSSARGEGLGGPAEGGASAGGRGQVDGPRGAPPQRCPNFPRLRWVLGGLTRHRRPSRSGAGVARLAQPLFCLQRRFQVPIKKVGGPLLEPGGRSWGFAFPAD